MPVIEGGVEHGFGGFVEPAAAAGGEVALDFANGLRGAEVHVGGFPAHAIQEALFVALLGKGSELDAGTVGSEAPYDPAAVEADAGIFHANGAVD